MHPATHRALREIAASGRLLALRWSRLADRIPDTSEPLDAGAEDATAMVDAITALAAARDVPVGQAAQGLGSTLGLGIARLGEPFLERNQALRTAVHDAHHVTVLLHYAERLARGEGDDELAAACHEWAHRIVRFEGEVRDAALDLGDEPDLAIEPVDGTPVGRAAHGVAAGVGAAGEWVDRRRFW